MNAQMSFEWKPKYDKALSYVFISATTKIGCFMKAEANKVKRAQAQTKLSRRLDSVQLKIEDPRTTVV